MRIATRFSMLCCVIALTLATSARAEQKSTAATAMQAAPSAGGVRQALPVGKAHSNLDKGECEAAGGRVFSAGLAAEACDSGQVCSTTDQNGKTHAVCLSRPAAK